MAVIALITVSESDTYNVLSTDWVALSDAVKEAHIYNASVYMQGNWDCVDVDWEDTTTLDDDLKRACAYYADADSQGLLTSSVADTTAKGRITEETAKVGSLSETIKYSDSGQSYSGANNLESIDGIMKIYCTPCGCKIVRT